MKRFHSAREAKEFLISKIIEQAERDCTSLSGVERKMLYFSEADWTLPDISAVSEEFDRVCDVDEYERKIADLIRRAYKRLLRGSRAEYDAWWLAIQVLKKQDHYLLVMVDLARLRPRWDQFKLLGAGILVVVLLFCSGFLSIYLRTRFGKDLGTHMPSSDALEFLYWAIPASLVVAYCLLRVSLGKKTVDDFVSKPFMGLSRLLGRAK